MKKNTIKKALISLSFAFAVSAAALGANALVAKADGETINPAFSTFKLQNGASVRLVNTEYEEDENQYGYSYVMEMSKEQYNAVMSQDSDFTNVRFGMLIGPEAYFDAHPFNTQANIDAYYSLNEEVAGKAFLYDIPSTGFVDGKDESKVYYRASITEIKDFVRDMRGVAYVQYVYEGTPYKFFFTDESNMRCAVEVADLTIDLLDEEKDAAYINTLKSTYINKIDWSVEKQVQADKRNWLQWWGYYDATGPVYHTNKSWVTKYNNNRYINSKYTTEYAWTKEGEENVPYYTTSQAPADVKAKVKDFNGVWVMKGVTTCEFLSEPVVSFEHTAVFQQFGGWGQTLTVNGGAVTINEPAGYLWDETENMHRLNHTYNTKGAYYKSATGDFIVDLEMKGGQGGNCGIRIYTSNNEWVQFSTVDGAGGANINGNMYFYFPDTAATYKENGETKYYTSWWTETRLYGNENVFTNVNERGLGATKLRIVNYNKMMYLFSNTAWDSATSQVITLPEYKLLAMFGPGYSPLTFNGMSFSTRNMDKAFNTAIKELYAAATSNQFGFVASGDRKTFCQNMKMVDDDAAVKAFMEGNTDVCAQADWVNGELVFNAFADKWTQDENGYWSNTAGDNRYVKLLGEATGDYMLTLKIKTTGESDFRIYYGQNKYFGLATAKADNVFFDSSNGWWSETRVGYNTAKFANDNKQTNKLDGYLDLMIVRSAGVYYIYSCEYLDAESKVATWDNWQLLVQFNADGTTPVGEGLTIKNANNEVVTTANGTLTNATKPAATCDNMFALRRRSGNTSAKVVVVDDDAAVAAFMASEKAVATYAKA